MTRISEYEVTIVYKLNVEAMSKDAAIALAKELIHDNVEETQITVWKKV